MSAIRYRRPPELDRLGSNHAVVEASAGTGKTYLLEHLVIDLLLRHGAELDQILIVTFTEKATAELVGRIRAKLVELRELSISDPAPESECWVLDDGAREKLGRALLEFDRATIATIHGFCQRVLTEHAFLHRRLFDEEAVDESEAFHAAFLETVRRDVGADPARVPLIEAWLRNAPLDRLEELLRKCRRELVCMFPPRPEALRPGRCDLRAAAEALARFPSASDDTGLRDDMRRHKIRANSHVKLVRELAWLFAAAATRDEGQRWAALDCADLPYLERTLAKVPDEGRGLGLVASLVRRLGPCWSSLAAELAHEVLPLVEARLEARKREAGLFDFQDMLTHVARGLERDDEDAQLLRQTLRARYRHALIDEFQDTDEVQWTIFRRLFLEGADQRTLTVIGDPKQAIYGFRGADVHTYLRAGAEIRARQGEAVHLKQNFRSTKPLIDAYNAILADKDGDPFFRAEGGIHYEHPVTCGRPELALLDAAGRPAAPVVVLDVKARAETVVSWQVRQALKAAMVRELQLLLSEGLTLVDGTGQRRLGPGDVFVLTRSKREAREVGDALAAAAIPFAFYKQERLFETVEAREVLDLLCAIADPEDRTARSRALITGFFALTLPDLAACEDLPATHPLVRLLYDWRDLADSGQLEAMFARIVEDSGLVCREVFLRQSERALTNYLHVLEILQEEAARTRGTIRQLAQTLGGYVSGARKPPGEGSDLQRLDTDADAVQIMTIHHAKGLEAPVVFVYGALWDLGIGSRLNAFHDDDGQRVVKVGVPGDDKSRCRHEKDDEERRVFYVALTRAKARLYLPRYPAAFESFKGSYKFVNDRLNILLDGITSDDERALFQTREVTCPGDQPIRALPPTQAALAAWRPEAPVDRADPGLPVIAERRAGFHVTSYSAVKRRHGGFVPREVTDDPAANEPSDADAPIVLPPDELPRGRVSGRFVHELLELVPLETLRGTFADWRTRIGELTERVRRRHDVRPVHVPHAERLVHTALTTTVRLGDEVLPGIATADHLLREMEFLYPIPEARHPALGTDGDRDWRIERGVVKGFIDVLFEHRGRTYVCDWKGDWLPSWDRAHLAGHCGRNYDVQARLYALAALRLLGVTDEKDYQRRFGGVLYAFVRGMRAEDPDAGLHFRRPSWAEVRTWEAEMRDDRFWGFG